MRKSKICFKCQKRKLLKCFYPHPQMADGHLNKCILCNKKDTAVRVAFLEKNNPEWVKKEAQRQRDKETKRYYRIKHTAKFKAQKRKNELSYKTKYPEKKRAVYAANNAVRDGRLQRKTECERCGVSGIRLEKHHADYSKPLEVEFLCRLCHKKETWKNLK